MAPTAVSPPYFNSEELKHTDIMLSLDCIMNVASPSPMQGKIIPADPGNLLLNLFHRPRFPTVYDPARGFFLRQLWKKLYLWAVFWAITNGGLFALSYFIVKKKTFLSIKFLPINSERHLVDVFPNLLGIAEKSREVINVPTPCNSERVF